MRLTSTCRPSVACLNSDATVDGDKEIQAGGSVASTRRVRVQKRTGQLDGKRSNLQLVTEECEEQYSIAGKRKAEPLGRGRLVHCRGKTIFYLGD